MLMLKLITIINTQFPDIFQLPDTRVKNFVIVAKNIHSINFV